MKALKYCNSRREELGTVTLEFPDGSVIKGFFWHGATGWWSRRLPASGTETVMLNAHINLLRFTPAAIEKAGIKLSKEYADA